ncbi:MAG: hypothetical protein AAF587_19490 [Bacteroidota bacterium]
MKAVFSLSYSKSLIWMGGIIACWFISCQAAPDVVILRQSGEWELKRIVYEEYLAQDLIAGRDTVNQGDITFFSTGNGSWLHPDSSLTDFTWSYEEDIDMMRLGFEEIIFSGEKDFDFNIIDNSAQRQVWQSENSQYVWNSLQQDSSENRILLRWQLERKDE